MYQVSSTLNQNLSPTYVYLNIFFVTIDYCINEHVHCHDWATIGECEKNPDYMLIACKKACHSCGNIWWYNHRIVHLSNFDTLGKANISVFINCK